MIYKILEIGLEDAFRGRTQLLGRYICQDPERNALLRYKEKGFSWYCGSFTFLGPELDLDGGKFRRICFYQVKLKKIPAGRLPKKLLLEVY